jgi:Ribbon-helix-helix protein, copG family
MGKKYPTSIRLTPEAARLLKEMATKLGITRAAVMEIALRRLAEIEGVMSHTGTSEVYKLAQRTGSNTFEALIREWVERRGWSPRYEAKVLASLERELFPRFGHRPITEIEHQELMEAVGTVKGGAFEAASQVVHEWIDSQIENGRTPTS